MKVKCNWCEWAGIEEDLDIVNEAEFCPECGKSSYLMDIEEGDEQ